MPEGSRRAAEAVRDSDMTAPSMIYMILMIFMIVKALLVRRPGRLSVSLTISRSGSAGFFCGAIAVGKESSFANIRTHESIHQSLAVRYGTTVAIL